MIKRYIITFIALALLCPPISAQTKFGKWEIITNSEMHVARTGNSANSYAGVICMHASDTCTAYVSADDGCDDSEKYPLMINSSSGSYISETTCFSYEGRQFLLIDETTNTVAAFESGGQIGFAIPLKGGQFRVVRFDGSGAKKAVDHVRRLPPPVRRNQQPASQVL